MSLVDASLLPLGHLVNASIRLQRNVDDGLAAELDRDLSLRLRVVVLPVWGRCAKKAHADDDVFFLFRTPKVNRVPRRTYVRP